MRKSSPDIVDSALSIRPALLTDREAIFEWRNMKQIVALSSNKEVVDWDEHREWYKSALGSPHSIKMYVIESAGQDIGLVRFNAISSFTARISVYVTPKYFGTGFGSRAVAMAIETIQQYWLHIKNIEAIVLRDNIRGQKAFVRSGFTAIEDQRDPAHLIFRLGVPLLVVTEADRMQWSSEINTSTAAYEARLVEHGVSFQALGWGSSQSQQTRFAILSEVTKLPKQSILDVGCGFGDYSAYLKKSSHAGTYLGIDVSPEMIKKAQSKHPDANFVVGSIFDIVETENFDFVVASGIFTFVSHAPYKFFTTMLTEMMKRARRGIAVNCLSTFGDSADPGECQLSPARAFEIATSITKWVTLRHDYSSHDFTLYLRKEI